MAQIEPELVSIQTVDPTIIVDLRYAGPRNLAQRPLYPPDMPALVRPSVAARLGAGANDAQKTAFNAAWESRAFGWEERRPALM